MTTLRVPRLAEGDLAHLSKRAVVAAVVAFAVPTAISLAFTETSFVGGKDERTATFAATRYEGYLTDIAGRMALIGIVTCALLIAMTFFVLTTYHVLVQKAVRKPREIVPQLLIGLLVAATAWGRVAHDHPGLFIETLSQSRLLTALANLAPFTSAVLGLAILAGVALWLFRAKGVPRVAVGASLAVPIAWQVASTYSIAKLPPKVYLGEGGTIAEIEKTKSTTSPKRRPNVLWIAVDSLRPDMIDPQDTPNIARLLDESVYFPNGLVTVPRTGPSWASALTGLSPLTTGLETMFPRPELGQLGNVAMPAHLASLGYRTAVISEYAGEFFGRVKLGFQVQSVPRVELAEISGQALLGRAPLVLSALGQVYASDVSGRTLGEPLTTLLRGMPQFSSSSVMTRDALSLSQDDARKHAEPPPFFYLLFFSQPHFPYTSNAPYYGRFRVSGANPAIAFGRDPTNEVPIESEADRRQVKGLYRGALAETDAEIGRLLDGLRTKGLLDDTIVILSSDHGEGLYECGTCVGHGENLRGLLTLNVPIAFRLPQRYPFARAGRRAEWVSTLDIYPTVLRLLDEPRIELHEGNALLEAGGGANMQPERTFFAETGEWLWQTPAVPSRRIAYPPITGLARLAANRIVIDEKWEPVIRQAKYRAAIKPPFKLTYEPGPDGVVWHLYRTDKDPYDDHDVSAEFPAEAAALREALRRSVLRHPHILPVGDYFTTRATPPPEEEW